MVHLALQVLEDVAAVEAGAWTRFAGVLLLAATVVVLSALLHLLQFTLGASKKLCCFLEGHCAFGCCLLDTGAHPGVRKAALLLLVLS